MACPSASPIQLSALGYLWLGETQEGLRGACGSCCMAAFYLALEERFCLRHSTQSSRVC